MNTFNEIQMQWDEAICKHLDLINKYLDMAKEDDLASFDKAGWIADYLANLLKAEKTWRSTRNAYIEEENAITRDNHEHAIKRLQEAEKRFSEMTQEEAKKFKAKAVKEGWW